PSETAGVPGPLLEKYFESVNGNYLFDKNLRRCIIFGRHDLIQDSPISRIDLLVCRNTLMYFNAETQGRILSRFHFALNPDGFLFLGKAEMLLLHGGPFTPVDLKRRIFAKVTKGDQRDRVLNLAHVGRNDNGGTLLLRETAFDTDP